MSKNEVKIDYTPNKARQLEGGNIWRPRQGVVAFHAEEKQVRDSFYTEPGTKLEPHEV